jgi:threonine/homoserine/homoserine lactone efflux protein
MPLHTWWTFVIATFFICATPGPNMLLMMSSGIRHGFRATCFTMAGCMSAVLSITTASAAGADSVLKISPHLFDVMRLAGAGYLIYLGVRTAFAPTKPPMDSEITAEIPQSATPVKHFKSGFTVAVTNPKLLLFATAFFPQFIDRQSPQLPQIAILLASFFPIELGWYITYAAGGSHIARYLRGEKMQKAMNRCIGVLFAGFGVLLLKWHPA